MDVFLFLTPSNIPTVCHRPPTIESDAKSESLFPEKLLPSGFHMEVEPRVIGCLQMFRGCTLTHGTLNKAPCPTTNPTDVGSGGDLSCCTGPGQQAGYLAGILGEVGLGP